MLARHEEFTLDTQGDGEILEWINANSTNKRSETEIGQWSALRDSAVQYAEKLKAAGVAVTHVDYPSMIHGYLSMQGLVPLAAEAIAAAAHAVKDALK